MDTIMKFNLNQVTAEIGAIPEKSSTNLLLGKTDTK